jgi:hypothetical protein
LKRLKGKALFFFSKKGKKHRLFVCFYFDKKDKFGEGFFNDHLTLKIFGKKNTTRLRKYTENILKMFFEA